MPLWITYCGFAMFGLTEALLGVAWPSIRTQFQLPTEVLGIFISTSMTGLLISSLMSGWMIRRWGLGRILFLSTIVRSVGMLMYASSWNWETLLTASFISGFGAGAIASGSNTYLAQRFKPSQMSWLHAIFGIGAVVGPLLITSLLQAEYSWKVGYLISSGLELLVAVSFGYLLWSRPTAFTIQIVQKQNLQMPGYLQSLKLPLAWLGIVLFFLYRGMEVAASQWTFTLFTDTRSLAVMIAGVSVSLYWFGMTAGRILSGILADKIPSHQILRASILGSLLGFSLLTLNLSQPSNLAALVLAGFSMAAIFPLLTTGTPHRVGSLHTSNIVGFQIAGGSLGSSVIPSLVGLLGRSSGLESLGPLLIAVGILLLLIFEVMLVVEKHHNNDTQLAAE